MDVGGTGHAAISSNDELRGDLPLQRRLAAKAVLVAPPDAVEAVPNNLLNDFRGQAPIHSCRAHARTAERVSFFRRIDRASDAVASKAKATTTRSGSRLRVDFPGCMSRLPRRCSAR